MSRVIRDTCRPDLARHLSAAGVRGAGRQEGSCVRWSRGRRGNRSLRTAATAPRRRKHAWRAHGMRCSPRATGPLSA